MERSRSGEYSELDEGFVNYCNHLGITGIAEGDCCETFIMLAKYAYACQSLPNIWRECESGGRIYYYHKITRETSWSHPIDELARLLLSSFGSGLENCSSVMFGAITRDHDCLSWTMAVVLDMALIVDPSLESMLRSILSNKGELIPPKSDTNELYKSKALTPPSVCDFHRGVYIFSRSGRLFNQGGPLSMVPVQ